MCLSCYVYAVPFWVENFFDPVLFSLDLSVLEKLGERGDRSLTAHTNVDSLGERGGGGGMMRYGNGTFSKNSGSNPVTSSFGQGHVGPSEALGSLEVRKKCFVFCLC